MASITTRTGKGGPLTFLELDANFTNLNTAKLEKTGEAATFSDLTLQSVSSTLHRSPNAITALFVYDTSKDSDLGAWTEKCQHTSWYQETIYGKWLGAQASEAAARAVTGATTDDYYQLTTDGKFYKLNATSGVTEVFRGNKRAFPKLAAIVAEAASVTIYDLTEAGRPMWIRLRSTSSAYVFSGGNSIPAISLHMLNGILVVGLGDPYYGGLAISDFAKDRFSKTDQFWAGAAGDKPGVRQPSTTFRYTTIYPAVAHGNVRAITMAVLPDAPLDPATGLKVPTILVATDGGLSLIQNSGTVRNSSSTLAFTQVTLTPQLLSAGRADAVWYYAANPGSLGASFALTTKNVSTATDFNVGNTTLLKAKDRANYARTSGAVVQLLRNNEGTIGKGIAAKLSDTYNTGWLVGDIRRAYLASNLAGSIGPSQDIITGDDSTFTSGIGNWLVPTNEPNVSISHVTNRLRLTNNTGVGSYAHAYLTMTGLVSGRVYFFSCRTVNTSISRQVLITTTDPNTLPAYDFGPSATFSKDGSADTISGFFTATASTMYTRVGAFIGAASSQDWDDFQFFYREHDRSYKAATSTITGTLTATAVNTGNDLVAYSGFSAANYIREPYSADLDFGTGEWSVSAWVNVPTANAAAGTAASRAYSSGPYITLGIDATNKLIATAYDGTTTRTVTTTAAYNTGTWLKADARYTTDGKLAILVNGVEVASATGTALLTLNNSNAVLTIGNSYALDAPFPGSLALLKLSANVPTAEQSVFMYEQEKHLFSAGAKCVLPASTSVLDLAYDDATDTWSTLQATYESSFSGLVRTSAQAPSAGSFSKSTTTSGVKLLGRATTNPGVDVQMPAKNLRPKDMPKDINQDIVVFDYFGGFTATTTLNSTSLTSVAASLYPSTTNLIGCAVSGTGIPASTVITGISGTTIYMSQAATANGSAIQISTTDFNLPVGYTARAVLTAGTLKREGSTADYTRLFNGFVEAVRYAAAPGYNAWVQIQAVKEVAL